MEKRCRECFRICKWLESTDMPKKYTFDCLKPKQIISVVEDKYREHIFTALKLENIAISGGNQLAVVLSVLSAADSGTGAKEEDNPSITFIAQCESTSSGTELWFRFGVDDDVCHNFAAMEDFHALLSDLIESLDASNLSMSECGHNTGR